MSIETQKNITGVHDTGTLSNKKSSSVKEQPILGIGAGILAAIAGCTIWLFIAQKFQMPWLAAAIAFGIASAIKYAGKTKKYYFGIAGAILSTAVALIGNLGTAIFIYSKRGQAPSEIVAQLNIGFAMALLQALLNPLGILFYAAAIYIGYWYSFQHPAKKTIDLE